MSSEWIIGVDEAGRGPLAGPVTLAAFFAPYHLRRRLICILGGKIRDSKQLTPLQRKSVYKQFSALKKEGRIFFQASHVSNSKIDKKGITFATGLGIKKTIYCIIKNSEIKNCNLKIVLDGLLKAPEEFNDQKTIIKGDETNVFIACASVVAKVRRDMLMCRLSKKHPEYSFERHKGYGTPLHRALIERHGFSEIHRKTFCTKIDKKLWSNRLNSGGPMAKVPKIRVRPKAKKRVARELNELRENVERARNVERAHRPIIYNV